MATAATDHLPRESMLYVFGALNVLGAMHNVLEVLGSPVGRVIMMAAVLVILLLSGYYVVRKFRDHISRDEPGAAELLSNFEEIHHRGTLSDEEYRTIKTALGEKLQRELKDKGETT